MHYSAQRAPRCWSTSLRTLKTRKNGLEKLLWTNCLDKVKRKVVFCFFVTNTHTYAECILIQDFQLMAGWTEVVFLQGKNLYLCSSTWSKSHDTVEAVLWSHTGQRGVTHSARMRSARPVAALHISPPLHCHITRLSRFWGVCVLTKSLGGVKHSCLLLRQLAGYNSVSLFSNHNLYCFLGINLSWIVH